MQRFQQWGLNPGRGRLRVAGGTLGWATRTVAVALPGRGGRGVCRPAEDDRAAVHDLGRHFSLQNLYRDGGAARIFKRVVVVFITFSMVVAVTATLSSLC
ncbi:hypothetical protein [Duganella sp. BJB1802]|uniref:hypothetical protein n=1 Tax=Duganella sp. BJB1802 TaxID=2744575 RepID=UPI001E3F66EC|nr:hypothetical protein [Duganella sp. BJB1802]